MKDYYAELPISIRVTGKLHDFGAFAADIANLSRIVTLHNLVITAQISSSAGGGSAGAVQMPTGLLTMEATARTYRYLDPSEVPAKSAAASASGAAAAKPGGGK
jgi:type IV pilus assembly protein PilO